jgi:hypothetical protein
MTTGIILVLSGMLIGAGFALVWRDIRRSRRQAFLSEHDTARVAEADVEITVARPERLSKSGLSAKTIASAIGASLLFGRKLGEPAPSEPARVLDENAQAAVMADWAALHEPLEAGVDTINALLQQAQISIGQPGESAWSYKNHGYGVYRRILIGEESVAWLRLELAADNRLNARVKAHKDDRAEINATAQTEATNLTAKRAGDLLADCLKPLAAYVAKTQGPAAPPDQASAKAWEAIDGVVAAALSATNGALSQAGARLVPLDAPAWHAEVNGHRLPLAIEVYGKDVARMHIDHRGAEVEVAVGVPDALFINLGRRRRIAVADLATHPLAEVIADCAWPVISRSRDSRRSA